MTAKHGLGLADQSVGFRNAVAQAFLTFLDLAGVLVPPLGPSFLVSHAHSTRLSAISSPPFAAYPVRMTAVSLLSRRAVGLGVTGPRLLQRA